MIESEGEFMLISDKQQEANRQNAQHSCGPKTPEGKEAVRLNALTYGLRALGRARSRVAAPYRHRTVVLEQMSTSQRLLARIARGESRIYHGGRNARAWRAPSPRPCGS